MYKEFMQDNPYGEPSKFIIRDNGNGSFTSFLADPANTDYQQFKKDIMAGGELQDADGAVMTDAQEFVTSLP